MPYDDRSKCVCGCGCTVMHSEPCSGYCRRCQAGDCPNPDEDIPATCPQCGKKSNMAHIEEFGYCLRPTCKRPANYTPWSMDIYEWAEWAVERELHRDNQEEAEAFFAELEESASSDC